MIGSTGAPGGLSHSYDAEGHRTSTTQSGQTTTLVNDPRGPLSRVLWRIRPDGTRTFYIHGPVLLYEIEESHSDGDPANAARFYHYDHLGSTIALSNDDGQPVARANYSPYGILIDSTGTLNTPFLWQGAFGVQTDPNGLHHMRARYYHCYMGRFLSEDPIGLSGGPNMYAYCNGNPITAFDPSGMAMFGLFNTWGDYFYEVGQVFAGYGDAAVGTVAGLMNVVASPIQTSKALGTAIAHPVNTFNAVATAASESWNSGSRGQGRVVGEILIAAATVGTTKAVATAGKAEELVQVSRWGKAGLADGDWVQLGGVTKNNFRLTGKGSSLGGNQVAEFSSGASHTVPSSAVHWPSGMEAWKGVLGQRIYDSTRTAISYGAASAVGYGSGVGVIGASKAGFAAFYK